MVSVTILQLHGVCCECCNDTPSRCVVLTKMPFSQKHNNIFNNYYSIIDYIVVFIGPCIILIVEELKTNLMSLVIFISLIFLLNMFRTLICPSSGACDCVDGLPHRLSCSVKIARIWPDE